MENETGNQKVSKLKINSIYSKILFTFNQNYMNDKTSTILKNLNIPTGKKICPVCDGEGYSFFSCCGDDVKGTIHEDMGICPTCHEHIDGGEEQCETCNGEGFVTI